jgi:hypothetical protein
MSESEREPLDGVLDQLEHELPESQQGAVATAGAYESPTLTSLEPKRRPDPKPVCETCPQSMWFASAAHLKCYCRVMHAVTWNSEEPLPILSCDGILLSSE